MDISLALEYIPRRMKELGHGTEYYLRFRHLLLDEVEVRELDAFNQLYILIGEPYSIRIESDFGFFDNKDLNEASYEHQGLIRIENKIEAKNSVKFIQIIPKHKTK